MKSMLLALSVVTLALALNDSAFAGGRSRVRIAKSNRHIAVGIRALPRLSLRSPKPRIIHTPKTELTTIPPIAVPLTEVPVEETQSRLPKPETTVVKTVKRPLLTWPLVRYRRVRR